MKKKVSILVPCYNEEEAVGLFYRAVTAATAGMNDAYDFEFVFVDDGSRDATVERLRELRQADRRVNIVELSRNFGKETALLAGMDYATGDCVINMDADLQDPPEAIAAMVERWENGAMDVYGRRCHRDQGAMKKLSSRLFHRLLHGLSPIATQTDAGDFRLLDRRCVDALRSMRESQRYTKGLYDWIGFGKEYVDINVAPRVAGKSKWTFMALVRLGMDGITSHSLVPLRLASVAGMVVSACAFIFLMYVVVKALVAGDPVAGYPSLMAVMLFLGGTILLALGIMGEYVGRIFMETKGRPPYFISRINGHQPADNRT